LTLSCLTPSLPKRIGPLLATCLVTLLTSACARQDAPPERPSAAPGPERSVTLQCGNLPITLVIGEDEAVLTAAGRVYRLQADRSTAGTRDRTFASEDTELRSRDGRARLVLEGEPLPECLPPGAVARPFEARGNEPFWRIVLDGGTLTLDRPARDSVSGTFRWQSQSAAVSHGRATLANAPANLTVRHEPCTDSMTGMPHPRTVTVEWRGQIFEGCGGSPERLLRGGTWIVDALPGHDLVAGSRPTVRFLGNGRVAGSATCNRYKADYRLTGEGLTIGRGAMTRRACPPALMEQEERFMDRLQRVHRFRHGPAGRLELMGAKGPLIRLRLE